MSIKKLFEQHTPEELVESFVFPVKLTAKQQREADVQLAKHRAKRRAEMTDTEKLNLRLLQLKFRLEDYITGEQYNPEYTFGYFLEQYLQLTNRKKKEFAEDIQIHETQLSQMLKDRREPNNSVMVRLELHSNNIIPAVSWFKLLEKEKAYQLKTDKSLRDKESKYVIHNLQLV
jgi:DNA-binding transcriptional regulator YdaS (Cro superfamily)